MSTSNPKNLTPGAVVEAFRSLTGEVERGFVLPLSKFSADLAVHWADGGYCPAALVHPGLRVMEVCPPKVEEPIGRYAVVRLAEDRFAFRADADSLPWRVVETHDGVEWCAWHEFAADVVEVLFEGVPA